MTFFVFSVLPAPDSPLETMSTLEDHKDEYARNENALVFPLLAHAHPSSFSHSEDVRGVLVAPLQTILLNNRVRV